MWLWALVSWEAAINKKTRTDLTSKLQRPEDITVEDLEEAVVWDQLDVRDDLGRGIHLLLDLRKTNKKVTLNYWISTKKTFPRQYHKLFKFKFKFKFKLQSQFNAKRRLRNYICRVVHENRSSAHESGIWILCSPHESGIWVSSAHQCGIRVLINSHKSGIGVLVGAHQCRIGITSSLVRTTGTGPHQSGIRVLVQGGVGVVHCSTASKETKWKKKEMKEERRRRKKER